MHLSGVFAAALAVVVSTAVPRPAPAAPAAGADPAAVVAARAPSPDSLARILAAEDEVARVLRAAPRLDPQEVARSAYTIQHHLIWEEVQGEPRARERARPEARHPRRARHARHGTPSRAHAGRGPGEGPRRAQPGELARARTPVMPSTVQAIPSNVRANDPTQDLNPSSAGQSELSLGAIGPYVMVSWNDGDGWDRGTDVQGVATSGSFATSLIDRGNPPHDASFQLFRWKGDPVVTTDEKRGYFYLAGLGDLDRNSPSPSFFDSTALFVARGTISRGGLSWQLAHVARALPNATWFLDKEWMAADSSTGNLYIVYTLYNTALPSSWVMFQRSADFGGTWNAPVQLSSAADAGDVQGAQITVGPAGEIHTLWFHNDPGTGLNQLRYRRSLNGGISFEPEQTVTTLVPNFGTGAPGFNRPRGIDMPSLTTDRTEGQYRGRVYAGFSQAYNYLNDAWPAQPPANTVVFESEPNGTFVHADNFVPGQTLRGSSYSGDRDDYFVYLTAGQHLIVWLDSLQIRNNQGVDVSVFGTDTTQSLGYGIASVSNTGVFTPMMYTITAPYSGWYYVQAEVYGAYLMAYRLRTQLGVRGSEPGRDRRDVFACWSQGGTGGWSTPVRVCDSPIGMDDYLPELAVGPDGYPYMAWFDGRNDLYGAATGPRISRSDNGGVSWRTNEPLATAEGSFNDSQTNIVPNMGDYIGLCAGSARVHAAWGDARGASVDAWTASFLVGTTFTACPPSATIPVLGSQLVTATLQNQHPFYSEQYLYAWADDRHWVPYDANGYFSTGPGGTQSLATTVTVPIGTAQGTVDKVCLTVSNSDGALVTSCCFDVTALGTLVAVDEGAVPLGLGGAQPNPAPGRTTIAWSLPKRERSTIAVFDVAGARVRTLADGEHAAGRQQAVWDGRDDRGRPLGAGMYFVRLEAEGRRFERSVVLIR